ncbi:MULTISPECIES: SdpI family protein [Arthrobacter]|uniref:SdpI family protein n=2 Tax=Arthrobacter TaxID=1663 RepID=A0ABU9KN17_9MICC|nr:SdpI family protein [Arthrobacter sp. YJM1]MDP5227505.1 SdpI family protein [Arthrobacter sp. YJM1]
MRGNVDFAGVILAVAAVGIIVSGVLALRGRLPLNFMVGIRLPATMKSEAAWNAGHKAAAPLLILGGVSVGAGAVLTFLGGGQDPSVTVLPFVGGLLLCVILAAVVAVRAAHKVTGD